MTMESDGTTHPTSATEAEGVTEGPTNGDLPKELVKPEVSDRKLQNYVDQYYKGINNPNRIGDGTTADAVRYEMATNQPVGGKWHTQKAEDLARGLTNWLKNTSDAADSDVATAQQMLLGLLNALGGK